jgi:hypothetical protein
MSFAHLGFVGDVQALELVTDAAGGVTHLLAGAQLSRSGTGADYGIAAAIRGFASSGTRTLCAMFRGMITMSCCLRPAGTGSQLLVYQLPGGRLLHSATVLPDAARVHGIAAALRRGGPLAIAVHGDHYVKASCLTVQCASGHLPSTGTA